MESLIVKGRFPNVEVPKTSAWDVGAPEIESFKTGAWTCAVSRDTSKSIAAEENALT